MQSDAFLMDFLMPPWCLHGCPIDSPCNPCGCISNVTRITKGLAKKFLKIPVCGLYTRAYKLLIMYIYIYMYTPIYHWAWVLGPKVSKGCDIPWGRSRAASAHRAYVVYIYIYICILIYIYIYI